MSYDKCLNGKSCGYAICPGEDCEHFARKVVTGRLVDADKLEGEAICLYTYGGQRYIPLSALRRAATVDAVPLIRARWFYPAPGDGDPVCTNCNCELFYDMYYGEHRETPYCPHCGAKMEE